MGCQDVKRDIKEAMVGPEPDHKHQYSKWSEPQIIKDWFNGPRYFQYRTCEICGELQKKSS